MKFCCIQKQIVFENESRWEEVSLLHRIKLKMFSTTNSLESSHGHLNKRTARRNSFYGSLFRIINELILKYGSINKQLQHNYNFLKRKTMNQLKALDYNQLRFQMIFYETTEKTCLCGQNKLECALYNIDIPCIHRLALGVQFPSLPQIDLNINFQYQTFEVHEEEEDEDEDNIDPTQDQMQYVFQQIKNFSHSKRDKENKKFVEESHSKIDDQDLFFIRNQRVSMIQLIEEGIQKFKQIKKETKYQPKKKDIV